MKQYLLSDLSSMTNVPIKTLSKFAQVSEFCICDSLNELDVSGEELLELDIGVGTISFLLLGNSLQYSFVPSKSLEEKIVQTLEDKSSSLTDKLELNLENKLVATYKELL